MKNPIQATLEWDFCLQSENISKYTEGEQKHKLGDPEETVSFVGRCSRFDIINVATDQDKKDHRDSQKNRRIIMECRDEVQTDERHEHTGDSAAGALESCYQQKDARNADVREGYEYIICDPDDQNNRVSPKNCTKTGFHALIVGQGFVDGVLDQRVGDDIETQSRHDDIDNAAGAVFRSA